MLCIQGVKLKPWRPGLKSLLSQILYTTCLSVFWVLSVKLLLLSPTTKGTWLKIIRNDHIQVATDLPIPKKMSGGKHKAIQGSLKLSEKGGGLGIHKPRLSPPKALCTFAALCMHIAPKAFGILNLAFQWKNKALWSTGTQYPLWTTHKTAQSVT